MGRICIFGGGGGSGDVSGPGTGPGSSTDNALVRWDGNTGTLIQNSNAILSDAGVLTLADGLVVTNDILWSVDGGGDIGASSATRPDLIFLKTGITIGNTPATIANVNTPFVVSTDNGGSASESIFQNTNSGGFTQFRIDSDVNIIVLQAHGTALGVDDATALIYSASSATGGLFLASQNTGATSRIRFFVTGFDASDLYGEVNNVGKWDIGLDTGTQTHDCNGSWSIKGAGQGLNVAEGTNARMGADTLVAGTVTVSTTAVTATSRILLTGQNSSGVHGELTVSARTAATSFTITSSSAADTRLIAWVILEPA